MILEKLLEGRVLSVSINEDNKSVMFGEECDGWFKVDFDKKELGLLIEELKEIHEKLST